jgi:very-short-patch-repair endonuclease
LLQLTALFGGVRDMNRVEAALAALAEGQYGAFARSQALDCGFSDDAATRRVINGDWEMVLPAVYRLPGAPRSKRQRAFAATLWGGSESAISHATAWEILRLEATRSDELHLTIPHSSGLRHSELVLHRTTRLPDIDRSVVDGIPCTSATRTLIDCAAELDGESLEAAFESARRLGLTTLSLLRRRSAELCGTGRPGSARVRRLIALAGQRAVESRLEVKMARLLRGSPLPEPMRQHRVGPYRIDFVWLRPRVGCECDGFTAHGNRLAWKRDRRRLAWLEAAGWRMVLVTWDDVTLRPSETIDRLAFALRDAAA